MIQAIDQGGSTCPWKRLVASANTYSDRNEYVDATFNHAPLASIDPSFISVLEGLHKYQQIGHVNSTYESMDTTPA